MGLSKLNLYRKSSNTNYLSQIDVVYLYRNTLIGFIFLLILILLLYLVSRQLGFHWPYGSMLFRADDRFNDLLNSIQAATTVNPYSGNTNSISPYFPLTYAVLNFFSYLGRWGSITLYFLIGYFTLYFGIRRAVNNIYLLGNTSYNLRLTNISFIFFILSYPYIYAVDRGGLDFWVSGLLFVFIAYRGVNGSLVSIFAISVAIALKGYPLAFCLILLSDRKYKELICIALLVFLLTFISLLSFDSPMLVLIESIKSSQVNFFNKYVLGADSLFATADLFSAMKLLILIFTNDTKKMIEYAADILPYYMMANSLLVLCLAFAVLFLRLSIEYKLILVTLISAIYPNLTNDYRLTIFVLPAFYMSLTSEKYSRLIFWVIIAILAPKSFVFYGGHGLTGFITPLLFILLGVITFVSIIKGNGYQMR